MSTPHEPTETYEDGSAVWDNVEPFTVSAHPASDVNSPAVVLDGITADPQTALALAEVLNAAALHALRKSVVG